MRPKNWQREFLYYRSLDVIYYILRDIRMDCMGGFFHKRDFYLNSNHSIVDEKIIELFNCLKINHKLKSYIDNLFKYCFELLPIQVGFPKKYLSEKEYEKQYQSLSFVYEVMKFQNEVDENGIKKFDEKGFEIERTFTFFNKINLSARGLINSYDNDFGDKS